MTPGQQFIDSVSKLSTKYMCIEETIPTGPKKRTDREVTWYMCPRSLITFLAGTEGI